MPLPSPRDVQPITRASRACRFAVGLAVGLGMLLPTIGARAENLQELYLAAQQYDATYRSAQASLEAAQYRLEQQYALRRPNVGLSANAGRNLSSTPDAATQSAYTNAWGATLSGTQTLFNRPNDKIIAQAEKALESARSDVESAGQDLILRVSQAYFDVLAAQDTLNTARSSKAAISETVASAKRNFEVGTATITDTREAQARFDLARATEIQGENDLITRRVLLDQLVGRANIAPKQLAVPVALPSIVPADIEDWVKRADIEHPQVQKARLNLEVARLETERARAASLPTVAANASVGRGHSSTYGTGQTVGLVDNVPTAISGPFTQISPSRTASIGVTLTVPIFAGFAIQNRLKETLALEDKATDDLEAVRRSVAQTTRTSFYALRSGAAQVLALEAAESSSQLALEATQLGYKVGVRVNIDVLNAQAQLYSTQAQLAQARYNVVIAGLRLRQASGRLTADDVAAVNRLLQP